MGSTNPCMMSQKKKSLTHVQGMHSMMIINDDWLPPPLVAVVVHALHYALSLLLLQMQLIDQFMLHY